MIENFTPAPVPFDLKIDGDRCVVIGWSNTADGLQPVVVTSEKPCKPEAIAGLITYRWPNLTVTLVEGSQVAVNGAVEVYSGPCTSPVRVTGID
jgi:hypothetical protein